MKFPSATMQSPDDAGASGGPVEETQRKKIAERDWIDAADGVCETESDATGMRYTYLEDGKSFTWSPKTDDAATRMLAIFGALTLSGNVTNTWKIEKGERAASPTDAIAERFALLETGQWIDRSAGAVGAKLDKDALAEAVTAVAEELYTSGNAKAKEKVDAAGGIEQYKAAARQRIEDSADYVKDLRKVKSVMDKYNELVGKPTKSADDIL